MTEPPNGNTPNLRLLHGFLVWVLAWWSFVLAMPGETFGKNPKLYYLFTTIMTEDEWAFALGVAAILGALGIKFQLIRLASIHLLCSVHFLIAALLFIPNPIGTGSGVYAGLSVAGYYLLWRQRHPKVKTNV